MTLKNEIGAEGEQLAVNFLINNGFEILDRNYRYKRAEVDIICRKEDFLVFVEVKFRKNNAFGEPEDFVNERKIELIQMASENYVDAINWNGNIRFDIISITKKSIPEIEHLEDAF